MKKIYFFPALFLALTLISPLQEVRGQDSTQSEHQMTLEETFNQQQKQLEQINRNQMILHQIEMIQIDHISNILREKLFNPEGRQDKIIEHYAKHALKSGEKQTRVALLGNSAVHFSPKGFNEEILTELLNSIKLHQPDAVFFLGNLVHGLKDGDTEASRYVQLPEEKDVAGRVFVDKEAGVYDTEAFEQQLDEFSKVVTQTLGGIPFYPVMGDHESIGLDSAEIFKRHFHLDRAQIIDSRQLVYSVPVGNALFLLLSTDYFDQEKNKVSEDRILPGEMEWLKTTLENEGGRYRFSFVLGSDPAFSTKGSFGIYEGIDRNIEERNRFWRLLKDHNVLAYFSGNEIVYGRTFRYGIWQINTGGAGAIPDYTWKEEDVFFHYVLMTLPHGDKGNPQVEVYDRHGKRRDQFSLTKDPFPFYQVHISKSIRDEVPEVKQ